MTQLDETADRTAPVAVTLIRSEHPPEPETDSSSTNDPGEDDPRSPGRRDHWFKVIGFGLIALGLMLFWSGFQLEGHDGGDDFALYVDQARSLLHGNVGETLAATRYTVDNSAWHTFSTYSYPWGLPLLLVPVLALTGSVDPRTGIDYGPLKLVISACFLVGLFAYHAVLRRRVAWLGAVLLPLFFAVNFIYVTHLDQVLSEFTFLMSLMLFVVAFDRVHERDLLFGERRGALIALGLLACFAFNIRREGLGVLCGLALGQLACMWTVTEAPTWQARTDRLKRLSWRAVGTPWFTFVGASILFQVMLPSDILPRFTERDPAATAGIHRIVENMQIYRPLLAEQLGIKDIGPADVTVFNSELIGTFVYVAVIGFAVFGMILGALRAPQRELPVIGVLLGVGVLVLSAPFQTYRYIMALVPFVLYFAYQGVSLPIQIIGGRRLARLVVVADLALASFIVGGWHDTANARDYRTHFVGPQPGPQLPASLEMYQAVRTHTRGDSIIVANRARLMHLYTGRVSIQGGAIEFVARSGDFYAMYVEPDGSPGTYSQYPLTDDEATQRGFEEVWRNTGWVLWKIPPDEVER